MNMKQTLQTLSKDEQEQLLKLYAVCYKKMDNNSGESHDPLDDLRRELKSKGLIDVILVLGDIDGEEFFIHYVQLTTSGYNIRFELEKLIR